MNRFFKVTFFLIIVAAFVLSGCSNSNVENKTSEKKANEDSIAKESPLYTTLWSAGDYYDTITSVAFTPDGNTVATGSDAADNVIRFYNTETGQAYKSIDTPENWHIVFTPDGKTLISGGQSTVKFWDFATGDEFKTITGISISLRSLILSPYGKTFVTGGLDNIIKFWDAVTGDCLKTVEIKGFCWFNTFSPDGRYLATGGNSDIQVIDTSNYEIILTLKGYIFDPMNTANNDTFAAVFTPDGKYLITGGADDTIRFWEIPSGNLVRTLDKQDAVIKEMVVTPDGNFLMAGSYIDLAIFDMQSGSNIKTIPGIKETCAMAISPDGRTMATGGVDMILRLWKIGE